MNVASGERGGRKPEPARPEAPNPESGVEASQVPAEEAAAAGKPNGSGEKRDPGEAAGKTQRAGQPEVEPALSAGTEPAGSAPEAASAAPAGRAAWSTAPGAAAAPGAPTLAELQDRWLRAEADLRNLRRRAAIEREEARRSAEDGVLLEMIAMLDDLDRALEAAREAGAPESWTEGVRLTADRVRERLARYGVVTLDPAGKPFDPHFHEALLEVEAPKGVRPGVVVQVVHAGYARGERALRPARVVVARAPAEGTGH